MDWLYPNLSIVPVLGDGSCYFHSILQASSPLYQRANLLERKTYAREFRDSLAAHLPEVYSQMSNGALSTFAEYNPEYRLENLIQELKSNSPVDYVYHEVVSNLIQKDIYIIHGMQKYVVKLGNTQLLYKHRPSIVIYYTPGHYQVLGLKENDTLHLLFSPDHPFICHLRNQISEAL